MRLKTYLLLVLVLILAMGMGCSKGTTTSNGTFTATRSNAKNIPGYTPAGGFVAAAVGAISN
jgi:hypothetical protein